jgi:hypothetical protein
MDNFLDFIKKYSPTIIFISLTIIFIAVLPKWILIMLGLIGLFCYFHDPTKQKIINFYLKTKEDL